MNKDEMIEEMAKWLDELWVDYPPTPTEVAEALYNANYRKVADDGIVVKKSEYESLKKDKNDYKQRFESSEKRYEQLVRTSVEALEKKCQYWETKCKEIGDFASKETVRNVLLQIEHDSVEHPVLTIFEIIDRIADKYDVNLEDCHAQR